ncbi:TetR/AcrR family transcriptional regulator [Actinotalea ferrariae]|uniref:TetR/AcrR family transcriptional regulator n=1 Tax=Actinotalea ferrariae TaxID=1386098 RepID=UPI001C8CDDE1|nr:TetR/AcrR family transcriptional regulator [Actinotalea ferrariae]MBX9245225.1 TetR/AcrR family transcriptional regulator [Actinotalea ferrariae]
MSTRSVEPRAPARTTSTSGGARPVGRPARYSQDDLVAVVARVFIERGYEAASMADLARASGLTKSAFYHHVSGKEELLRLAVSRALDALDGVFEELGQVDGGAVARLERVVRRTTEILVAELPYVTLLLRVRGNTAVEREAVARRRAFDARLADLVREAMDAGEIRDDVDPRLVTRLLFGMVNSITEWYRPGARGDGEGRDAHDDVVRAVVELAMDGMRARRVGEGRPVPAEGRHE